MKTCSRFIQLFLSYGTNESGTTRQCKLRQTNKWFYVITCPKLFGYSYSVGTDKSGRLHGSNNKQINYDK